MKQWNDMDDSATPSVCNFNSTSQLLKPNASALNRVNLQIESLVDDNRYRDAYDVGVQHYGEIRHWPTLSLRLAARRIVWNLGSTRFADALMYRIWREFNQPEEAIPGILATTLRRRGALEALDSVHAFLEKGKTYKDPEIVSELFIQKAGIFSAYRDFSEAEAILASIDKRQAPCRLAFKCAELQHEQDKPQASLTLLNGLLSEHSDYAPAIQLKAEILQHQGKIDASIHLLEPLWLNSQSWWVGQQLYNLYLHQGAYREATAVVDRLESLSLEGRKEMAHAINALRSDLLCAQQRYEDALPYLNVQSLFSLKVADSITRSNTQAQRKVLDVPFVRQKFMTCAPASLCAVSQYWGKHADHEQIIRDICYGGTQSYDERRWANENNWVVKEFELDFQTLKSLVDKKIPVLFATVDPGAGHLQVIVGYDESMGTYLMRDPYYPRLQEILVAESKQYYAASGPRCMAIVPDEKKSLLNDIAFPASDLYDGLYAIEASLAKHDRVKAASILKDIEQRFPGERLTAVCQRTLAYYDGNENKVLNATESLLKAFPYDANNQLVKIQCLLSLGSNDAALAFLEKLNEETTCHFLVKSKLANQLRWDHRNAQKTERLYKALLKANPYHAATLYGYAGVLWDAQAYGLAYQFYRFVTCMEDTTEGYAESYFKAARYHNDTEKALAFLQDRFHRFGEKSSGPAISLFNALDSLLRTHEGLDILKQALTKRPNDGQLLLFAAKKYLNAGQRKPIKSLMQRAKKHASELSFNVTLAELHEVSLNREKAISANLKVLAIDPLNTHANHAVARLYNELNQKKKALDFIQSRLHRNPNNAMLLQLQIQWTAEENNAQREALYEHYIACHSSDSWGYRGLSETQITNGKKEKGLQSALNALAIDKNASASYAYVGDAYMALGDKENARTYFSKAIRLSCDYTYAYARLLATVFDAKKKQKALQYIHEELMKQVNFGDGFMAFLDVAWNWLDAEKLLSFMKSAVTHRPDLWQSWVSLCMTYRRQGDTKNAIVVIRQACKRFPLLPRMYFELGECYRVGHHNGEAKKSLRKALDLSPGWGQATNVLCDVLEREGSIDDAIALQEGMIARSPFSCVSYGYLADLLLKKKDTEAAKAVFKKAIEINDEYEFAWSSLYALLGTTSEKEELLGNIKNKIDKQPENPILLGIFEGICPDSKAVKSALFTYLERNPHDVSVCTKLISRLTAAGEHSRALELCSSGYWHGEVPITIHSNKAWVYHKMGQHQKAIFLMEAVTRINSQYYEAWRFLASWYEAEKDTKKMTAALDKCVELHPNQPEVLAFAADKLINNDGSREKIKSLLKHAFELDVSDQYNALAYIDVEIEDGHLDMAQRGLEKLDLHSKSLYAALRWLNISVEKRDKERAFEQLHTFATHQGDEQHLLKYAWQWFEKNKWQDEFIALIEKTHRSGGAINSIAGRILADYHISTKGIRSVERSLAGRQGATDFDQRYIESYIRYMIDKDRAISRDLRKGILPTIEKDTLNKALFAYADYEQGRYYQAIEGFKGIEKRPDVEPWMLYFYSIALRFLDRWRESKKCVEQALLMEKDDYANDLLIWKTFDTLAQDQASRSPDACLRVSDEDIAPLSRYIRLLCHVQYSVERNDIRINFRETKSIISQSKVVYKELSPNAVVEKARRFVKAKLLRSVSNTNVLTKIFWKFRLSFLL